MRTRLVIVGGGSCALMLAGTLDPEKFEVSIYERNAALGRKFLVAGEGGLNLTHSESSEQFIGRYTPQYFLEEAFKGFSNTRLREWFRTLGIETYVGSSGRVFPQKGIKPIDVLNVLLERLKNRDVQIFTKHILTDLSSTEGLVFEHQGQRKQIKSDLVVFCLGGASWPVTGSLGDWGKLLEKQGIKINPFRPSNCAYTLDWPEQLIPKIEGKILKNCRITCGASAQLGEVVITRRGLEGSGIYPLSPGIRDQLDTTGKAKISIDLKPNVPLQTLLEKLTTKPAKISLTEHLKKGLNLSDVQVLLLKQFLSREDFLEPLKLVQSIKHLELSITGTGPIEDAISTVGGLALEELDANFQLKKMRHHYAIGEMLDYDAPTGGYLLQSCFSMGDYLAMHLNGIKRSN